VSFSPPITIPTSAWETPCTNQPATLGQLTEQRPLLLVFLRHLGCTFCREALADLARHRQEIDGKGVTIGLVHLVEEPVAKPFFEKYGLADLPRFSDPLKALYQAFGLKRVGLLQMLGVKVWLRGFQSAVLEGHGFSGAQGDALQMPGVFLLHRRGVMGGYIHRTAADRPDYCRLADGSML
jgi:peroxiredoxin